MFSKPVAKGGKESNDYYKKEFERNQLDYYTHKMTRMDKFFGGLAEQLKLTGQVTPGGLDSMVRYCNLNQHRQGAKKLDGAPVDFFDMPFSVPKSVSLLATNPAYREIVLQAMEATSEQIIKQIEQDVGYRKREKDGAITTHYENKIMGAKCLHYTNRYNEPDLHFHLLISNLTQRADGKYVAINSDDLFNHYIRWGVEARRILATELQHAGIALTLTNPEKAFFEVAGLDNRPLIEQYSRRTADMIDFCRNHGWELTDRNLHKAQVMTRPPKEETDTAAIYDRVNKEIFVDNGHEIRTYNGGRRFSDKQREKVFLDTVHRLEAADYSFAKADLCKAFLRAGVITDCKQSDFDRLMEKHKDLFVPLEMEERVNMKKHIKTEIEHLTTKQNVKLFAAVEKNHKPENNKNQSWGIEPAQAEKQFAKNEQAEVENGGYTATAEQRNLVMTAMCSPDRYVAINGLAGTGKTFSYKKAIALGKSFNVETIGIAPNGAAAEELHKSTGIETATMAKFFVLMRQRAAADNGRTLSAKKAAQEVLAGKIDKNTYKGLRPLEKKTMIIVDEAGLSDMHSYYELEEIAKRLGPNCKIVYSGDPRQLKPVGAGDGFEALVKANGVDIASLTDIYRQKSEMDKARTRGLTIGNKEPKKPKEKTPQEAWNKYRKELSYYNKYKDAETTLHTMYKEGDICEIKGNIKRQQTVIDNYLSDMRYDDNGLPVYNDGGDNYTLLVTTKNETCDMYNETIHRKLLTAGHLNDEQIITVNARNRYNEAEVKQIAVAKGERIRFKRNYRAKSKKKDALDVKNGTYATIEAIAGDGQSLRVRLDDGRKMMVDLHDYNDIDRAYCVTAYSSQGASAHRLIADIDGAVDANMNYVVASRVKDGNGLKIYVPNAKKYIQQAQRAQQKDGPRANEARRAALREYRKNQKLHPASNSLDKLADSNTTYLVSSTRAAEKNVAGIVAPEESARMKINNMPRMTGEQAENLKPQRKLEAHNYVTYKASYDRDVILDRDMFVQIASQIMAGERPIIRRPIDMWQDLQKHPDFEAMRQANWTEFYKRETGGRVRRIHNIRLSKADMQARNKRLHERFEEDFKRNLASAGFYYLKYELLAGREVEVRRGNAAYRRKLAVRSTREPTREQIEITPPPPVSRDTETLRGKTIAYYKSVAHSGASDKVQAVDILATQNGGEFTNAHLFANEDFMAAAMATDPSIADRIYRQVQGQVKEGETWQQAFIRTAYTQKLRQSRRGYDRDIAAMAKQLEARHLHLQQSRNLQQ